ncbi:MAG: DUF1465 family protein [Alphaproteobacteria bacterium]
MVLWVETKEFEDVFEETVSLLTAVKGQVESNMNNKKIGDISETSPEDIAAVNNDAINEMKILSNLTVCLTSITSWLILNRAFNAGEVSLEYLIKEGKSLLDLISSQNYDKFFAKNFGNNLGNIIARSRHLFGSIKELTTIVENHKV